ncbi:2TM domain-containing protein [Micromonospora sp. NPDC049171]|uniref:2TM domain-containing protein n=2 Tax=unclassified Micromonospora TaxID=2617518 RepID=UPI0033DF85AA
MTSMKSEAAMTLGLRLHVLSYVIANPAQIVVWWFATPDHFFWPVWSILGWGVGLAFHVWATRRFLAGSHRAGQPHPGR